MLLTSFWTVWWCFGTSFVNLSIRFGRLFLARFHITSFSNGNIISTICWVLVGGDHGILKKSTWDLMFSKKCISSENVALCCTADFVWNKPLPNPSLWRHPLRSATVQLSQRPEITYEAWRLDASSETHLLHKTINWFQLISCMTSTSWSITFIHPFLTQRRRWSPWRPDWGPQRVSPGIGQGNTGPYIQWDWHISKWEWVSKWDMFYLFAKLHPSLLSGWS